VNRSYKQNTVYDVYNFFVVYLSCTEIVPFCLLSESSFSVFSMWRDVCSWCLTLSERCLRSLTPLRVQAISPPNNKQLKQNKLFFLSLAVSHGFLLYHLALKCLVWVLWVWVKAMSGWSGPKFVTNSCSISLNVLNGCFNK